MKMTYTQPTVTDKRAVQVYLHLQERLESNAKKSNHLGSIPAKSRTALQRQELKQAQRKVVELRNELMKWYEQ